MEKREFKILCNYYYGIGKSKTIWSEEVKKLHNKKLIRKIYEITDIDNNDKWYLIRTINERSYILKSKKGNVYSKDIINDYSNDYNIYRINTDIIKLFNNGCYPIVFKVKSENFDNFYDSNKNINNAFFNNYYCNVGNFYKCIREYRNKVELETFIKEVDAIYWCYDFKINKDSIIKNNIRPINIKNCVYEY